MELSDIVSRYAELLTTIDATTPLRGSNPNSGELYWPGVKALNEPVVVASADAEWARRWNDFVPPERKRTNVRFPGLRSQSGCDHVFSTTSDPLGSGPAWAIEVKRLQLVGNNGKANGFPVSKVLSPFLAERSMMHDVARLEHYDLADRHAVVGYAFEYSEDTCDTAAELHPGASVEIANIRRAVVSNGGRLTVRPLLDFADSILGMRGFVRARHVIAPFEAWRDPTAGHGIVFGWEVRRKQKEPGYDERHPW